MSSSTSSPAMWAQPNQLLRKIRHQLSESKSAPERAHFTEYDCAVAFVVLERVRQVKRDGWWTAEGIVELSPLQYDILELVVLVKLKAEQFRGVMTAAALARRFKKHERSVQIAMKGLEAVEILEAERELRAIVEIRVNNWFFEAERPERAKRAPGGMPKVSAQKAREIRHRQRAEKVDRFLTEREQRGLTRYPGTYPQTYPQNSRADENPLAPSDQTKNSSDHVLSKGLSSERTPYPLFSPPAPAARAAPPGGPPSTPNDNGTEERKRLGGCAASPRQANDDRTATDTAQGIQRHSGILVLTVPTSSLSPPE